tara:strand:- start:626 stop:1198 length:573 start_codon:yes stop_codon:yes gene_type:complete
MNSNSFDDSLDSLYIQHQVGLIDIACNERENNELSTPLDQLLFNNRDRQRRRYNRILNLQEHGDILPSNHFDYEFNNNTQLTGDFNSVFSNIFTHMEHEFQFNMRRHTIRNNFNNFYETTKPVLTINEYNNIPTKVKKDGECNICLEEYNNTECKVLKCGHCFHDKCIINWLTKHSSCCPVCRIDIKNNI